MISKKIFIKTPAILILLGFFSCQSLVRMYLGVDTSPQLSINNSQRMEYYNPFVQHSKKTTLTIYTILDTTALINAFQTFQNYPGIYLKDNLNDNVYILNCFEDVEWDVQNINSGNLENLVKANKKSFDSLIYFISNKSEIVYHSTPSPKIDKNNRWNLYMISGLFLGKKLRKRSLPILNIQGLKSFQLLDLSINIDQESHDLPDNN